MGQNAVNYGAARLVASTVAATDLRAGASPVIATIPAEGVTIVHGIAHGDRGFERLRDKLSRIGVVSNT